MFKYLFLMSVMVTELCGGATERGKQPVHVLIVDGFSNHDWQHTTRCIHAILQHAGGFKIDVSTFPADPAKRTDWAPDFSGYEVVIQTCNDIGGGPAWPASVKAALERYVKQGGGLYIFHSANNAFPDWPEYNRMIGLGWRDKDFGWAITLDDQGNEVRIPAGEGERTSHGKRMNTLLTRIGDHPIHVGLPRKWVAADLEVYRYARGPAENLTVLSFARDEKTQLNFPIEWTVRYGKGRVYNATFGHVWKNQDEPQGMHCAGLQTLMPRVVQWLAQKKVDPTVPEDFPSADAASLRSYPLK